MLDIQITDSDINQLLGELNQGVSDPDKRLSFDSTRIDALKGYDDIQACPGSGKTTLVGIKLLLLARNWYERHSGVCVLTHSNVAREEVLKILRRHPAGHRLFSYPHFVGTIQEFVNTFLGLPYARSRGWQVRLYARNEYAEKLSSSLEMSKKVQDKTRDKTYQLRYYINQGKILMGDLYLIHDSEKLALCTTFVNSLKKHIDVTKSNDVKEHFRALRKKWCEHGVFQYSEMYAFAEQLIRDAPLTTEALRHRFPIILIDEMQDTQRYQDDLINRVFKSEQCCLQRFGDPDQSIFDGIGGEEPNTSYNEAVLKPIVESHRFSPEIASKIGRLSYRRLNGITTSRPSVSGAPRCSIILFDEESIGRVLDRFADLVLQLPNRCRETVRAVGAVAESATSPLTIKSYWPDFQKVKQAGSFRPATLFEAVRCCSESSGSHVLGLYQILIDSVLELLQRAGKTTVNKVGKLVPFSASSLGAFLRENGKDLEFRELLAEWIMQSCPKEDQWILGTGKLTSCLALTTPNKLASEYLAFVDSGGGPSTNPAQKQNIRECSNGLRIAVSTIHGAKGETHDVTLVLETKHHLFDLGEMVEYLCNPDRPRPSYDATHPEKHESLRASIMKKIYVAASRPRYLLCLAMLKSGLSDDKREILCSDGWDIIEL
jgi:hypothetical protein